MALADPQSVTINAVPYTLARTGSGDSTGSFASSDGLVKLTIGSTNGKRNRHTLRLTQDKIASDPLLAGQSIPVSMSVYIVADVPTVGFSQTEQKQLVDAFTAYLTASSGARVTQLLGGEN